MHVSQLCREKKEKDGNGRKGERNGRGVTFICFGGKEKKMKVNGSFHFKSFQFKKD